jgi:hypothetical protein
VEIKSKKTMNNVIVVSHNKIVGKWEINVAHQEKEQLMHQCADGNQAKYAVPRK